MKAYGGAGYRKGLGDITATVAEETQDVSDYERSLVEGGEAGIDEIEALTKGQALARLFGMVTGGGSAFVASGGNPYITAAGAGGGSKLSQDIWRRLFGVGKATEAVEDVGPAPEGLFLSEMRERAKTKGEDILDYLSGEVGATRRAGNVRSAEDAWNAFRLASLAQGPTLEMTKEAMKGPGGATFGEAFKGAGGLKALLEDISGGVASSIRQTNKLQPGTNNNLLSYTQPTGGPVGPLNLAAGGPAAGGDILAQLMNLPTRGQAYNMARGLGMEEFPYGTKGESFHTRAAGESDLDWRAYLKRALLQAAQSSAGGR